MDIKFRYVFKNKETGDIRCLFFTLDEIQEGQAADSRLNKIYYELLARDIYTGLKDKHGKEMYKGDIVEFNIFSDLPKRCSDVVAYSNGCFKIEKRTELLCTRMAPHFDLEVIGNVYANPELWEGEKP